MKKTVIYIKFDYDFGYVWSIAFSPACELDLKAGEHFADLNFVEFENGLPTIDFDVDDVIGLISESDFGIAEEYHLCVHHITKVCNQGDPFEIIHASVDLKGINSAVCDGAKDDSD
jgi:hypothetical protein